MIKSDFINKKEFLHILAATIILALVIGFSSILAGDYQGMATALLFAIVIIAVSVYAKKGVAYLLDANAEQELWTVKRYGILPHQHFKNPLPAGIIVPLVFTLATLGFFKFMAVLSYEARALRARAARRFGYYSFIEMTDWHNALIGAGGILGILILAIVAYTLPIKGLEPLARLCAYYAFFNMIPFSKLDGTQIFFGSKVLYTILATITLIFTAYALFLI
jgi:hypothetical protein